MSHTDRYQPLDTLHLWYLGQPSQPALVGSLHLVMSGRGVSLRYDPNWLRHGFALSEDLPRVDVEHLPRVKDRAAGAVDDARPDRWGERVIRLIDRPVRFSILEMLYFAGDGRFGALGVSTSQAVYEPCNRSPLPELAEVEAIHVLVCKVMAGEHIDPVQKRLIAPGATMGGVRPKALIQMDGAEWVLKFSDEDIATSPEAEHAAMTLAAQAGIRVAETRLIPFKGGQAIAVRRFDRVSGRRIHAISANVALSATGSELTYPDLAQLLRRRGSTKAGEHRSQMRELFRRMVFNILIDNTDDHEKNHVLLMDDAQQLHLSPAFDVLPTGQGLGYQAMGVGTGGAESSIENALSMAKAFWLTRQEALAESATVAKVVAGWRAHFEQTGVNADLIELLARHVDRPYLQEQREQLGQNR
ncbi:MAG: HipA domain-containing protein [Betaproteobacteria bacterium]|nr:HipA domain-containing protein [Betaproteobacteria bacterium]